METFSAVADKVPHFGLVLLLTVGIVHAVTKSTDKITGIWTIITAWGVGLALSLLAFYTPSLFENVIVVSLAGVFGVTGGIGVASKLAKKVSGK